MNLKEEAKKALVPIGYEAIAYAGMFLPFALTGDAEHLKIAAEVSGSLYLLSTPVRYVFANAVELRKPKSKIESFIAKTVYVPLDVIAKNGFDYFNKKMPI